MLGKIGIVDYDQVEESNLQRQIIHDEARIGMPKSLSAKETVNKYVSLVSKFFVFTLTEQTRLNSKCECMAYETLLDSTNALGIIKDYDVIVDATDNVATRYLLNDAAVLLNKPLISGSALRMDGQVWCYLLCGRNVTFTVYSS